MNKEQDYASDTDESDEDFRPDELTGESAASEEEEADDSEANGEQSDEGDGNEETKEKPVKRKRPTKKLKTKKKSKAKTDDSDEEDCEQEHNTSRRATRRTDDTDKNGKGKSLEKDELVSDEEDKSRTNALWADFLKDVNPTAATSSKSNTSKIEDKPSSSTSTDIIPKESCTAAAEAIKPQTSLKPKVEDNKVKVTEVLDFAGEEVRIEREIDASSIKENKAATIPPTKKQPFSRIMPGAAIKRTIPTAATGSSGAGLGSILNQLGKKKKLSVLEKSQMDWNSFKQTEGIDEQLQTFNKGKDGYLERQDFLQRTDLRQFEIEKNLRQSTRRPF